LLDETIEPPPPSSGQECEFSQPSAPKNLQTMAQLTTPIACERAIGMKAHDA
jgi:hypothetical protein